MAESRIRDQINAIEARVNAHTKTLEEQNKAHDEQSEKLDTQIHQLGQLTNVLQQVVKNQDEERQVARAYRSGIRGQLDASRAEQQDFAFRIDTLERSVNSAAIQSKTFEAERLVEQGKKQMLERVLRFGWIAVTSIIAATGFILGYVTDWFAHIRVKP